GGLPHEIHIIHFIHTRTPGGETYSQSAPTLTRRTPREHHRGKGVVWPYANQLHPSSGPMCASAGQPASRYACSIIWAATRSSRCLRFLCVRPASHRAFSACVVVNRSSQ